MATTATTATQRTLGSGRRKLSLVDVVAQSVGFLGPVFSIAFITPLIVGLTSATGKGAGTAAPLAILIAGVGVLCVAWIVGAYARKIHAAGALYDYVTDGLGSKVGGAAGTLYYLGIIALGGGLLVMIAGTIHDTLNSEFGFTAIPDLGWSIILLALVAMVMFLGVALSTRAQLVLAIISILTVLTFSLYVITQVGSKNDVAQTFSPASAPDGWSGVLFGMVYAVLIFTGFETSANLGEETERPKRDIPRAVVFSVVLVTIFYLIVAYAQIAGYGFSLDAMGKNAAAPLFGLAAPVEAGGYGGLWVGRLLELVVVLDMVAVLIGISVAGARGVFAMARDERFPKPLAKVSRRGTPLNAGILVLAIFVLFVIMTQWTTWFAIPNFPEYFAVFSLASTFGGLALAFIYLLLCIGAFRGLRGTDRFGLVVAAAIAGIIVTAAAVFGAVYEVPAPTVYAVYGAVIVFVVGLIMSFVVKGKVSQTTTFDELIESERGPQKL